jgi:RimJ/RimL family protein N-acetyltransferase
MVVRLERVTTEWAEALAQGDTVFSTRLGIAVEVGWSTDPETLQFLLDTARDAGSDWGPHLVFDDDGALVGNGGWTGSPVHGVAELGYAVAPSRQGRGIATAVVRELIEFGRAAGLRTVVANTLANESPSTTVLKRCGFRTVSEHVDPEEGAVWRWELDLDCEASSVERQP